MSLECTARPTIDWAYSGTNPFGTATADRDNYQDAVDAFLDGSGNNQAQIIFTGRRTITTASTNDDLDLAGGLTDSFGQTLTFTAIKAILIRNRSTTDGDEISVGGAGSGAIVSLFKGSNSSKLTVMADGSILLVAPRAGYAVTATTADLLRVTHSGNSASIIYDIIIVGVGSAS